MALGKMGNLAWRAPGIAADEVLAPRVVYDDCCGQQPAIVRTTNGQDSTVQHPFAASADHRSLRDSWYDTLSCAPPVFGSFRCRLRPVSKSNSGMRRNYLVLESRRSASVTLHLYWRDPQEQASSTGEQRALSH